MEKKGCVSTVLLALAVLYCLAAFDVAPSLPVGAMKTPIAFGGTAASSATSSLFVGGGKGSSLKDLHGIMPRGQRNGGALVFPADHLKPQENNEATTVKPPTVKKALAIADQKKPAGTSFMEAFAMDPGGMGPGQSMTWTGVLGPKGLFLLARHMPEAFRRITGIHFTPKWIEIFRRDVPLLKAAVLDFVKLAEIVEGLKKRLKPVFTLPLRKKATRLPYPFGQSARTKAHRMCEFLWKKVAGKLPKKYKEGEENHGAFREGCGIKDVEEGESPDRAFDSLIAKFDATPILSYWSWVRALKRSPIMTPIRAVKVFIGDTLRGFPGVTSDYLIGSGTLVSSHSCLAVAKSFNDVLPLNYAFSGGIMSKGLYMTFRGFQLSFWQYLPLFRGVFSIILGLLCYIGVPKLLVQIFGIAGRIWRITKRAMQSGRIRYLGLAFDLLGRRLMEKVVSKYGGLLLVYLFQLTSIDMQEHMSGKKQDPGQERAFFAQADGLYIGFYDFAEKLKELKDEYEHNYDLIVNYCEGRRNQNGEGNRDQAGRDGNRRASTAEAGDEGGAAAEGVNQFARYQGRDMLPGEFANNEIYEETQTRANEWFMCRGYTAAKKGRSVRNFFAQLRKWLKIELQYILGYLVKQMSFLYDAFHVEATLSADEKVQASMKTLPHMSYENFARLQKEMWASIPRHTSVNDMTARMFRHPFLRKGIRTFTHLVIDSSTEWAHRGVTAKKAEKFSKKVGKVYKGLFGELVKAAKVYQSLDSGLMQPFDGKKEGRKIAYTLASGLNIGKDNIFPGDEAEDRASMDDALAGRHIFADIQEYTAPAEGAEGGPLSSTAHTSSQEPQQGPRRFKAVDLHGRNVVFQVANGSTDCIKAPSRQMIVGSDVDFVNPRTRRLTFKQGECETNGLLVFMDGKDSLVRATRDPEAVYAAIFTSLSDDSQGRNRLVANATTRVVMAACQEVVDQGRTWSYAVKTLSPAQFWKVVVSDENAFDDRAPLHLRSPPWLTFRNIKDSFLQALDGVVEALPFTGVQSRKLDLVSVFIVGFVYYLLQKFETVTQGDQYILEAWQRVMANRLKNRGTTSNDDAFMRGALLEFLAIPNGRASRVGPEMDEDDDGASTVASEHDLELGQGGDGNAEKTLPAWPDTEEDVAGDTGHCTMQWPAAVLEAMKDAKPEGMSWTRFFNVNAWMFAEHSQYERTEDATNIVKQYAATAKKIPGFLLMKTKRFVGKGFAKGRTLFGWLKRKVIARGPESLKEYTVCNQHCLMGILKAARDRAPSVDRRCYVDLKGLMLYGGVMRGTAKATAVLSKGLHMQLVLRQLRLETRKSKETEEILDRFRKLVLSLSPDMRTAFLGFLRSLDGATNLSFGLPEKLAAIFAHLQRTDRPEGATAESEELSGTTRFSADDAFDELRDFGDKGLGYLTDVLDLFRKTGTILGLDAKTRFTEGSVPSGDSGTGNPSDRVLLDTIHVGGKQARSAEMHPIGRHSGRRKASPVDDADGDSGEGFHRTPLDGHFDASMEPDDRDRYYPIAPQFRFNLQCMDELELSLGLRLGPTETIESRLLSWRLLKQSEREKVAGDPKKSALVAMEGLYKTIEKEKAPNAKDLELSWATARNILESLNTYHDDNEEVSSETKTRMATFLRRISGEGQRDSPVRRLAFVNYKHRVLVMRFSQALAKQPIEEPRSRLFDYLFTLGEIIKGQDTIQCNTSYLEYPEYMLESFAFESSKERNYEHRLGPLHGILSLLWGAKSNSSLPATKIFAAILNHEPPRDAVEEWNTHSGRRVAFFRTFLAVLDEAKIATRKETLKNKPDIDRDMKGWRKDRRKIRDWKFKAAWDYIFNSDSLTAVGRFHDVEILRRWETDLNQVMVALTRSLYDDIGDLAPQDEGFITQALNRQGDLVLMEEACEQKVTQRILYVVLNDREYFGGLLKPYDCEPAWHSKLYRFALILSDIKESRTRRVLRKVRNVARLVRKPFLMARLKAAGVASKRRIKSWLFRKPQGEAAEEENDAPAQSQPPSPRPDEPSEYAKRTGLEGTSTKYM